MLNFDDPRWLAQFTLTLMAWVQELGATYPFLHVGDTLASMQTWLRTYEASPECEGLYLSHQEQVWCPYLVLSDRLGALKEGMDCGERLVNGAE